MPESEGTNMDTNRGESDQADWEASQRASDAKIAGHIKAIRDIISRGPLR